MRYKYTPTDLRRFWAQVRVTRTCWLWTGPTYGRGYGQFRLNKRSVPASRFAYALMNGGEVPDDLKVCHTCDKYACVRNDAIGVYVVDDVERPRHGHLFLGSHTDNARDREAKGRHARPGSYYVPRGEAHHDARLTVDRVQDARERYATGKVTQRVLAAELGISQQSVGAMLRRETWKHVP